MNLRRNIVDLLLCLALAALAVLPSAASANHPPGFTENKGQIHDQHRKPNAAVLYLMNGPRMNVQLRKDGFAYDTYTVNGEMVARKAEQSRGEMVRSEVDTAAITFDFHRIDIHFVNADPLAEIVQEGESADYTNYYTDVTGEDGATFVRSYSTVTYRNVWPNIDVRFNSSEEGFKYDVIVRPGGDLNEAHFKVEGAGISESVKGELIFTWNDGSLLEMIPVSWIETGRKRDMVKAKYSVLAEGTFGFAAEVAMGRTLVIDPAPVLSWATFNGGSAEDNAGGSGIDMSGNSYLCGSTKSTTNMATAGTHDASYNSGFDAFVTKFSTTGTRLWGTYYGGTGEDQALAIAVSPSGVFNIGGGTTSAAGIASTGAHRTAPAGGEDGWLARFTTSGLRIWGTYYGGLQDDRITGLAAGQDGSIAYCGKTASTIWIASPYSADVTFGGGASDAFLGRFNTAGSRLWGSYLGGTGDDEGTGITFLDGNNVAICGSTTSSTGIALSGPGLHDGTYASNTDAFLAKYNASGAKQWSTYYGYTGADRAYGIAFVPPASIAICGRTESNSMATTGAAQSTPLGYTDGFLAVFKSVYGTRLWGTYCSLDGDIYWLQSVVHTANGMLVATGNQRPLVAAPIPQRVFVNSYLPNTGALDGGIDLTTSGFDGSELGVYGDRVSVALKLIGTAQDFATAGVHQTTYGGGNDAALVLLDQPPPAMMLQPQPSSTLNVSIRDGSLQVDPSMDQVAGAATLRIAITDAMGRLVYAGKAPGTATFLVPVQHLSTGVYCASLEGNGALQSTRFFIP